jgi:EF hand
MKRLVGIFALLVAAGLTFGTLAAGDIGTKGKDLDAYFHKLDLNMDGRLTKDEFLKIADKFRDKEKARRQLGLTYDKIDPEQKGLTKDQFRTLVEARAKRKDAEAKPKSEK